MNSAKAKSIAAIAIFFVFSVMGGCGSKPKPPGGTVDPNSECPTVVQAPAGLPTQASALIVDSGVALTAANYGVCGVTESDCPAPTVNGLNSIALGLQALDANGNRTQISAGVYPIVPEDPNDASTDPNMPNQKWARGNFVGFSAPPQPVTQGSVTVDSVTLGDGAGHYATIAGTVAVTLPDGTPFSLPLDANNICYISTKLVP